MGNKSHYDNTYNIACSSVSESYKFGLHINCVPSVESYIVKKTSRRPHVTQFERIKVANSSNTHLGTGNAYISITIIHIHE